MTLGTHPLSYWHLTFCGWVPLVSPSVGTYVSYVTLLYKRYVSKIVIYCIYVQYIHECSRCKGLGDKQWFFTGDMGARVTDPSGGQHRHERANFYQHANICTLKGFP